MVQKSSIRYTFEYCGRHAHVLFTQVTNNKISIIDFRTALVESLTQNIKPESYSQITTIKHKLIKASKSRCHKCYSIMVKEKVDNIHRSIPKKLVQNARVVTNTIV